MALKNCHDGETEVENLQKLRVIRGGLDEQIQKQRARKEKRKG